jgi:hypothetical protein
MPRSPPAATLWHPPKAQSLALTRSAPESKFATPIAVSEGRSGFFRLRRVRLKITLARWRSGYAAACKAVYTGSIPVRASRFIRRSSVGRASGC